MLRKIVKSDRLLVGPTPVANDDKKDTETLAGQLAGSAHQPPT